MRRDTLVSTAVSTLACASTLCGCAVDRKLVITSEPSGALVRLDDLIVGTTPYEVRFDAYGTRRVTLYRPGYRTHSKLVELAPPWYARTPIDFFSEVLFPVGWKDIHPVNVVLEPGGGSVTEPDLGKVLERARALRLAEPGGPRPSTIAPRAVDASPIPD